MTSYRVRNNLISHWKINNKVCCTYAYLLMFSVQQLVAWRRHAHAIHPKHANNHSTLRGISYHKMPTMVIANEQEEWPKIYLFKKGRNVNPPEITCCDRQLPKLLMVTSLAFDNSTQTRKRNPLFNQLIAQRLVYLLS